MNERFAWLKIRDRNAFALMTGVLFLVYMATGLWSPLIAVYARSLGAETGQIGLVVATFQITNLLSQYWWGGISDRLGRRKPLLLVGTAGLALAYIGIASAGSYAWLYAARALEGVALSAYSTGSLALIGDLLEDQSGRGRLMGIYRTFGSLAFSIAALSGGLLADAFSLRVPFFVAAACYAAACALGTRIEEQRTENQEPRTKNQEPPRGYPPAGSTENRELRTENGRRTTDNGQRTTDTRSPFSMFNFQFSILGPRRALWTFLALLFAWMFATSAVVSLWPVYMSSVGYGATLIGGFWALAALGEVPCMILSGHLSDRWGRKRVMLTGLVCMSVVYIGYTVSTLFAWLVLVQLLRAFAYASFEAPALLYATELGLRRQRGRLVGLYYSAGSVGGIAGAIIGGLVAQQVGLVPMFRSVVVFMLVTALVMAKLMPRLRTVGEEAAELAAAAVTR